MDEINKHIKKINSLSYNGQCKHIKGKLLSFKTKDTAYNILLNDLPHQLQEINIDIGVCKVLYINLWDRLDEIDVNKCFCEDIGLIKIECIKLPDNTYLVAIPVKNTYQFIYILIIFKNNEHCKQM